MAVLFRHQGDQLDYTPPADVAAGTMVQVGDLFGFAVNDIAANERGSLRISGVAQVPYNAAVAGTVPNMGALLGFNTTAQEAIAHAGGNAKLYSNGEYDSTSQTCWVHLNSPG